MRTCTWPALALAAVAAFAPPPLRGPAVRGRRYAADVEVAEDDVVLFTFPATGDLPELAGRTGVGVVRAEMHCTAHIQPLAEQGADQGDADAQLVEDESFEQPVQVQGGITAVLDAFYGQLPIPSLGGGVGYGAPAVECWTVRRAELPADVVLPVLDDGMAPWTH